MPRFFFGLRERDTFTTDPEGVMLDDLPAVQSEALEAARDIMAESIRKGEAADHRAFEITDERGEVVHVLKFKDVLQLP